MKVYFENGTFVRDEFCSVREQYELDGVTLTAVRGEWHGNKALDSECGAEIGMTPDGEFTYMADVRHSEFWCSPRFGKSGDYTQVDECQYFVYRKPDGVFGVIVPVVSDDYKCILVGRGEKLAARLFSWKDGLKECDTLACVTAEGNDPLYLTELCVRLAVKLLGRAIPLRRDKRYPTVFEYLGWCSWDALQIRVSERGLVEKCEELKKKDIPIKWAIIDDMWAEVSEFPGKYRTRKDMFALMHSSHLYDYEAAKDRFPMGLSHAIEKMHSYGMKVGIWHPTTGYWRGLDPNGKAYEKLRSFTYTTPDGMIIGNWREGASFRYYDAIHSFLRECGADFVKVDNQSMTRRFYKGLDSVGKVTRSWHRGLEGSVGLNFDNTMINCMGMASEDMWNRGYSSVCRASDDFQPEDRAWFAKHILQCTYNSMLQGQFYWSDYDMYWTDDTQAEKNSLLRAVSGGPIYVSDEIGRTRGEILAPLAFADGKILRCDRVGTPTADCLTSDPEDSGAPIKIQNTVGGSGVIAVFNIDRNNSPVSGSIKPSDVSGIKKAEQYVLYEHFSREMKIIGADETVEISLANNDEFRLYLIIPYENGFAPIGRVDKFVSPAAITHISGEEVELYESGEYGYIKDGELCIKNL